MSQSGVYCHHDGFNGCFDLEEYREKISGCGDSSTGLMMIDFENEFPQSRVVIIEKSERELKKCIEWCDQIYNINSSELVNDLNERLLKISGLRIKQSDITKRLRDIWEYLVDEPWNDKYSKIIDFNIQSNPFNIDVEAAKSLHETIQ